MFGDLRRSRFVAYSAAFIALITLGSWIAIPFFPVPLTLQTLFVLLAATVMKRHAVIPVTLYILLGALGLPVFHNGIAGIGVLLGPTGGYIAGFIPATLIAGYAYDCPSSRVRIAGLAAASGIILVTGMAWLICSTGMAPAAAVLAGLVVFLPGDTVKIYAVYRIAQNLP
jgi:biotin transport system substrate-specific component